MAREKTCAKQTALRRVPSVCRRQDNCRREPWKMPRDGGITPSPEQAGRAMMERIVFGRKLCASACLVVLACMCSLRAASGPVVVTLPGSALPAGYIRRMLHLGANETDRITGFPTSGLSILWDNMIFAGKGPEYLQ